MRGTGVFELFLDFWKCGWAPWGCVEVAPRVARDPTFLLSCPRKPGEQLPYVSLILRTIFQYFCHSLLTSREHLSSK